MSCYVTIQDVKFHSAMPPEDIDQMEQLYPGIVLEIATKRSAYYDSRLKKRYMAPFQEPYPDALIEAVAKEVGYRLYIKRGFNPGSAQDELIVEDHKEAEAWLKEAADSEKGLVELPIRQALPPDVTAVDSGGPLGYSEQSPYTWVDLQDEAVRYER